LRSGGERFGAEVCRDCAVTGDRTAEESTRIAPAIRDGTAKGTTRVISIVDAVVASSSCEQRRRNLLQNYLSSVPLPLGIAAPLPL
jgi:hypothetical protein